MTEYQEQAIRAIEAQQEKVKERSPGDRHSAKPNDRSGSLMAAWMVGEQLKDICRMEPRSAELIAQDLQVEAMGIVEAEKKIKAFADAHKTGNFSCVTPMEADRILREFYGLPIAGEPAQQAVPAQAESNVLRLEDFF